MWLGNKRTLPDSVVPASRHKPPNLAKASFLRSIYQTASKCCISFAIWASAVSMSIGQCTEVLPAADGVVECRQRVFSPGAIIMVAFIAAMSIGSSSLVVPFGKPDWGHSNRHRNGNAMFAAVIPHLVISMTGCLSWQVVVHALSLVTRYHSVQWCQSQWDHCFCCLHQWLL